MSMHAAQTQELGALELGLDGVDRVGVDGLWMACGLPPVPALGAPPRRQGETRARRPPRASWRSWLIRMLDAPVSWWLRRLRPGSPGRRYWPPMSMLRLKQVVLVRRQLGAADVRPGAPPTPARGASLVSTVGYCCGGFRYCVMSVLVSGRGRRARSWAASPVMLDDVVAQDLAEAHERQVRGREVAGHRSPTVTLSFWPRRSNTKVCERAAGHVGDRVARVVRLGGVAVVAGRALGVEDGLDGQIPGHAADAVVAGGCCRPAARRCVEPRRPSSTCGCARGTSRLTAPCSTCLGLARRDAARARCGSRGSRRRSAARRRGR